MIFTDSELKKIISVLNSEDLMEHIIKTKLEEVRNISINKRYSLRNTDWLAENGKKSRKRKNKIEILLKLL